MRWTRILFSALQCGVTVTPAPAADDAKPKTATPAVNVTEIHEVLEYDAALNAFFAKSFRVIGQLVTRDANAAEKLIDALEGKATLRSDGAVGRRSLEMVMAIYQSQLQGNTPVYFPVSLGASGVAALRQAGQFGAKER